MDNKKYQLVTFLEDKTVEIVPLTWCVTSPGKEPLVWWPNVGENERLLNNLVKNQAAVHSAELDWRLLQVKLNGLPAVEHDDLLSNRKNKREKYSDKSADDWESPTKMNKRKRYAPKRGDEGTAAKFPKAPTTQFYKQSPRKNPTPLKRLYEEARSFQPRGMEVTPVNNYHYEPAASQDLHELREYQRPSFSLPSLNEDKFGKILGIVEDLKKTIEDQKKTIEDMRKSNAAVYNSNKALRKEFTELREQLQKVMPHDAAPAAVRVDEKKDCYEMEFDFPIKTEEGFMELENKLASDPKFAIAFDTFLKTIGGDSAQKMACRILDAIATDSVQQHYSMQGFKGKKSLSKIRPKITKAFVDVIAKEFGNRKKAEDSIQARLVRAPRKVKEISAAQPVQGSPKSLTHPL